MRLPCSAGPTISVSLLEIASHLPSPGNRCVPARFLPSYGIGGTPAVSLPWPANDPGGGTAQGVWK